MAENPSDPAAGLPPGEHPALLDAVRQLLRPLARLAVARGLTHATVDEMLRAAFVEEAFAAYPQLLEHRRVSRISASRPPSVVGATTTKRRTLRETKTQVQNATNNDRGACEPGGRRRLTLAHGAVQRAIGRQCRHEQRRRVGRALAALFKSGAAARPAP